MSNLLPPPSHRYDGIDYHTAVFADISPEGLSESEVDEDLLCEENTVQPTVGGDFGDLRRRFSVGGVTSPSRGEFFLYVTSSVSESIRSKNEENVQTWSPDDGIWVHDGVPRCVRKRIIGGDDPFS